MMKMRVMTAALTAALGGCVGSPRTEGRDFPDGTLLRLALVTEHSVGPVADCGIRPSWTWRYWSQTVLVPGGPDPHVPELALVYYPASHSFSGQDMTSQLPLAWESDEAVLFEDGTFTYTHVWWDGTGRSCQSDWSGDVEVVE